MAENKKPDPAGAAKEQAAASAVYWLMAAAGVVLFQVLQRKASQPDAFRGERMSLAKVMEREYARLAAWAWKRAETWRVAYEKNAA